MGRYEKNYTGERRTEFIGFYVTPSERRQIEDAAAEAGSPTLSDWARDLLLARSAQAAMLRAQRRNPEAKGIMDALHAAARELNASGNNLNQIAHAYNATGEPPDLVTLYEALAENRHGVEMIRAAVGRVLDW